MAGPPRRQDSSEPVTERIGVCDHAGRRAPKSRHVMTLMFGVGTVFSGFYPRELLLPLEMKWMYRIQNCFNPSRFIFPSLSVLISLSFQLA